MVAFDENKKWDSYNDRFLYSSWTRSVLQSIPLKNDDLMHIWIDMGWTYKSAIGLLDSCEGYGKKKSQTFACAALLSYVPFGAAGTHYLKEKLGGKPVWQFRYETALNTFANDNAFFSEDEKEEFKSFFKALETDVYKNGFISFLVIVYKTFLACFMAGNKRAAFDTVAKIIRTFEDGVEEIDISSYLPVAQETVLGEEKIAKIEETLKKQQTPTVHIKESTKDELCAVLSKNLTALQEPRGTYHVNDWIKFKWTNLVLDAKVTEVTETETGDKVVFCAEDTARVNYGYYHLEYDKAELGEIKNDDKFTLILKNKKLYFTVGFYEEFLLTEKTSGEKMLVGGCYGSKTVYSREELLENLKKDIPSSISLNSIEQGAITDEEYENGLVLFPVECKEKE